MPIRRVTVGQVPVGHVPGRKLCVRGAIFLTKQLSGQQLPWGQVPDRFFDDGGKFGELVRTGTCPGGTCPPWKLSWGHLSRGNLSANQTFSGFCFLNPSLRQLHLITSMA